MNHKIKVVEHLHIGHHNWIEDVTVQPEIKAAKELVQQVLKLSQCPGGSQDDNIGKIILFYFIAYMRCKKPHYFEQPKILYFLHNIYP